MTVHLIKLKKTSIEKQLELELSLLREDDRSFLIINEDPPPAIVMGSSQKADEVIHIDRAKESKVPIIRRFSAGGCVILGEGCVMVSLILNKQKVGINLFPNTIMEWTEGFYKNALPINTFALTDNDYTIGNKKVGGNAQYIKKDRFLHHTSFLWDFDETMMDLLTHPPKEPSYRKKRQHKDFLTTLKPHLSKDEFAKCLEKEMDNLFTLTSLEEKTFY